MHIRLSALALRDVVTTLEIKHVHGIRTPRDLALDLEPGTHADEPHLFAKSLGDLCFRCHWFFSHTALKLIDLPGRVHSKSLTNGIVLDKVIGALGIR